MIVSIFLAAFAASTPGDAPTISQLYRPGDRALWVFEREGKRIGEHESRYLGLDEIAGHPAHHFHGQLRLQVAQVGGDELRSVGDLWLDDQGQPVRYTTRGWIGNSYSRADLEFVGADVHVRVAQGAAVRERTVSADENAMMLVNNYVSHMEIAIALAKPGVDTAMPMFSGNKLKEFTYQITAKGTFEHEAHPANGEKQTGYLYKDSLNGEMRVVDGRLLSVEVPSEKFVIRRSEEDTGRIAIQSLEAREAIAPFAKEDVAISNGAVTLAGRITKQKDVEGRLPAVFVVSGAGFQDRDGMESGLEHGTHEILDRLTANGFLALRVDDRGAGESAPAASESTAADVVSDARACLEFLRRRGDVDPTRIAILGQGEGGEAAALLAAELPSTSALVLIGASARAAETMKQVKCPVLILQGAKDFEVSVEQDARVLDQALKAAGNPDHELRVFEKLDHLLKESPAEKSVYADYWKERPVAVEALDALTEWLRKRADIKTH